MESEDVSGQLVPSLITGDSVGLGLRRKGRLSSQLVKVGPKYSTLGARKD